jgi:hypothetical protein
VKRGQQQRVYARVGILSQSVLWSRYRNGLPLLVVPRLFSVMRLPLIVVPRLLSVIRLPLIVAPRLLSVRRLPV